MVGFNQAVTCNGVLHTWSHQSSQTKLIFYIFFFNCLCVCLYVEPVARSKDYVRSRLKIRSVVCLYTPVSPSVPEMEGNIPLGGILFWGCIFGGVYIPSIYSHARWSYRRRFRSLLSRPLSVERYYFPLFVDLKTKFNKQKTGICHLRFILWYFSVLEQTCFEMVNPFKGRCSV